MTSCTNHDPDQTNANDGGLQPLQNALSRQSAGPISFASYFFLAALKMLSALPRCTAKPNLCSSQRNSLLSPVALAIRLLNLDMSSSVDSPYLPAVSIATGAIYTSGVFTPRSSAQHTLLIPPNYRC